jgi:hypothetical protein
VNGSGALRANQFPAYSAGSPLSLHTQRYAVNAYSILTVRGRPDYLTLQMLSDLLGRYFLGLWIRRFLTPARIVTLTFTRKVAVRYGVVHSIFGTSS